MKLENAKHRRARPAMRPSAPEICTDIGCKDSKVVTLRFWIAIPYKPAACAPNKPARHTGASDRAADRPCCASFAPEHRAREAPPDHSQPLRGDAGSASKIYTQHKGSGKAEIPEFERDVKPNAGPARGLLNRPRLVACASKNTTARLANTTDPCPAAGGCPREPNIAATSTRTATGTTEKVVIRHGMNQPRPSRARR